MSHYLRKSFTPSLVVRVCVCMCMSVYTLVCLNMSVHVIVHSIGCKCKHSERNNTDCDILSAACVWFLQVWGPLRMEQSDVLHP